MSTIFSINEIQVRLKPVLEGYGVRRAVLFGSYSKGNAKEESDIDIFVDSGLKGLKFVGLIEDIRRSLENKNVDVIDVTHIDKNSYIEHEIQKTGIEIYEK